MSRPKSPPCDYYAEIFARYGWWIGGKAIHVDQLLI